MVSESDCIVCPEGTFCSVGSAEAQPCAPGTYNDVPQQETCAKCAAGTFQQLEGQTACESCTAGCELRRRLKRALTSARGLRDVGWLLRVCQTTARKDLRLRCHARRANARTRA